MCGKVLTGGRLQAHTYLMSATEILNLINRIGDAGNLAEYLYNVEDSNLAARIRLARERGFYEVDEYGTITLTAKATDYLGR